MYELHMLLASNLKEEEVSNTSDQISGLLTSQGFNITSNQTRLNERLAYPIKHLWQAHTINMEIASEADNVFPNDIEARLRRDDNILRYFVLSKTERDLEKMKPMPIMDQLRRHERRVIPTMPGKEEMTSAPEPKKELEQADIEKIDEKIEELIK